ncbi:uncharacterized protein LOC143287502 [Babylonia areolata]|uniref:uncharacterized protein LOC143287502 n=1 Tax=Babylonia areolata TaxID=304850 RepID=UPI003FD552A7
MEQMKTKKFYIVFAFIVLSSGIIWLLGSPSPAFEEEVSITHKNARNLPSSAQNNQEEVAVDPVYLSRLGLRETQPGEVITDVEKTASSNKQALDRGLKPVIATSVGQEDWENARVLVQSVAQHLPGYHVVLFDLTSSEVTPLTLQKYCNRTQNCEVRRFEFEKYPAHVADLSIRSYRPVCIQEMLKKHGSVIWVDSTDYFRTGDISSAVEQAEGVGLVGWTIEHPTSAISHPKMFHYFNTRQDRYYFHRAVESSHLVVVDSPVVREKIMLPWVKCALLEDCISPTGAQNTGCNFMRKPHFKYSGCHFYDMSALNIILGPLFDFDERPYAAKETIFGNLIEDRKNMSDLLLRSRLEVRENLNGQV